MLLRVATATPVIGHSERIFTATPSWLHEAHTLDLVSDGIGLQLLFTSCREEVFSETHPYVEAVAVAGSSSSCW
jgi:hypothetical protein